MAVNQFPAGELMVARAAAGDETAFARLIAEHNGAMTRVAYVIVGDRELALDAVQSAWLIAWRRIGTLRDRSQIRSWLVAIAANEARQAVRRGRRAIVIDISGVLDKLAKAEPVDVIAVIDLKQALSRLNAEDRTFLALRFVARMDSNEIGRHLGVSASGVRSRLARLLDRLHGELDVREYRP